MLNPNPKETKTYEKKYAQRKKYGDIGEDYFSRFLETKYDPNQITYRQKEKEVDFLLPDFVVQTKNKTVEFEVKTTNKIKYRDFCHQLHHAIQKKLEVFYVFIVITGKDVMELRPIEIRNLLDYRLKFEDGVYEDSIPKPYFILDLTIFHGKDYEKKWVVVKLPSQVS